MTDEEMIIKQDAIIKQYEELVRNLQEQVAILKKRLELAQNSRMPNVSPSIPDYLGPPFIVNDLPDETNPRTIGTGA